MTELPVEILQNIFKRLWGRDVLKCREVCRLWCSAVDGLGDAAWHQICCNDPLRDDYVLARRKQGLSWRDVYRSLNSWSNIHTTPMEPHVTPSTNIQRVKVLPNAVLGCLQNNRNEDLNNKCSDTIVYYDLETFQECGRDEFDFPFCTNQFEENEHLQILIKEDGQLCIIPKINKKQFIVGTLQSYARYFSVPYAEFALNDNDVYFLNILDRKIYISKIEKSEDGEVTINTTPLGAFEGNNVTFPENIVSVHCDGSDVVEILTDQGNIYVHRQNTLEWILTVDSMDTEVFSELRYYGFQWKSRAIHDWLTLEYTCSLQKHAIFTHGKVILTTRSFTAELRVCIFYVPQFIREVGDLRAMVRGQPKREVFLKDIISLIDVKPEEIAPVEQLDVVETGSSHLVIVLVNNRVFILKFTAPPVVLENPPPSPADAENKKVALRKLKKAKMLKKLEAKKKKKTVNKKKRSVRTSGNQTGT